jgi:hypothetical protein
MEEVLVDQYKYLVLLPIAEMPKGAVYGKWVSLPMHCTLMHWFEITPGSVSAEDMLCNKLQMLAKELHGVGLEFGERASFGHEASAPVTLLRPNEKLNHAHTLLLLHLAKNRSRFEHTPWIGAGYRAHVPDMFGERFVPGRVHTLTHIALIKRDQTGSKLVAFTVPLGTT